MADQCSGVRTSGAGMLLKLAVFIASNTGVSTIQSDIEYMQSVLSALILN